jgi:hypothetical protein
MRKKRIQKLIQKLIESLLFMIFQIKKYLKERLNINNLTWFSIIIIKKIRKIQKIQKIMPLLYNKLQLLKLIKKILFNFKVTQYSTIKNSSIVKY